MNDAFVLLDNLHNSFMSLHNERMKEINELLKNFGKEEEIEKGDTSEKLDEIGKNLEDLLK